MSRVLDVMASVTRAGSPHIVKLYEVFETKRVWYLVLESVRVRRRAASADSNPAMTLRTQGGELFDYINKQGRVPRKEALRLMAQCVQGKLSASAEPQ